MAFQRSLTRLKMSPHFKTLEVFKSDDKKLELGFGTKTPANVREDIRQICKYLGLNFKTKGEGSQKQIYAMKLDRIRGKKRVTDILGGVPAGVANFYEAVVSLLPEHKSKIEDWFAQFLGGHTEALSSRHLRNENEVQLKGGIGVSGNIRTPSKPTANFRGGVIGFGEDDEEVAAKKKQEEEKKKRAEDQKAQEEAAKLKELKKEQKKLKKEAKKEIKKAKKEEKKIKKKQEKIKMAEWVEDRKKLEKAKEKNAPKRAAEESEDSEAKRRKQEPELEEDEDSSDADFQEEVWENVPEYLPPIEIVEDDSWAQDYCDLIRDVYADKNPSKTDEEIDDLLQKYGHNLYNLYLSVCEKYGMDPERHQRRFERRREDEGEDIFAQMMKQDKALLDKKVSIGVSSDEEIQDEEEDGEADVFFSKYQTQMAPRKGKGKGKGGGKANDKGKANDREDTRRTENPKEVCVAGFGQHTTQEDLVKFFKAGGVQDFEHVRYVDSQSRPLYFFAFRTEELAEQAVERMDGRTMSDGSTLYCRASRATRKVGDASRGVNPRQLFVIGVKDIEEETLKKFFHRHSSQCQVDWIKFLYEEDNSKKNVCFVTFSSERGAQKGLELDGEHLGDSRLKVQLTRGRKTDGGAPQRQRRLPREGKDWSKDAASKEGLTGLKHTLDDL
eukprot:gnl/MRDRNA2_/MRDRNA2_94217_c0_seq1.p1 gnl/MRDRNA2_/MRDRNA2_94217_c0~~gnl/MRDRNA2_/MRDRNA2_94217_c0_seq1.p1  ORF type:complete len:668 (+),score=203.63 gnl/MRDRNA2_/MRDRNA2_94217_c0_seq1:70-2073(+)